MTGEMVTRVVERSGQVDLTLLAKAEVAHHLWDEVLSGLAQS